MTAQPDEPKTTPDDSGANPPDTGAPEGDQAGADKSGQAKRAADKVPTRLPSHIAREMERAEERKRRMGSSGPASDVRRIDPKDYQPAPSSKPVRPPRPKS
jgi:hypothetical protein